ncbi:MAG: hypothetical protein MUE93_03775 [Ignavibacteriaceae bacterium]|jgi:hypothetical protein|nr:hypothetical protein [Ignavibacteriaceae bacterium]MCU0413363.1 hypothetical protein [Ignavibacteriaceae bacterium]
MRTPLYLILISALIFSSSLPLFAQEDEEPVNYFQMEPLDDSLFIHIQEELFIDPPDPKAEIVVDVRDANNQTISIKGALYPFLALTPELRARILTYPFKLNLEETVNFGSLYTRVINKLRFEKILVPPTVFQISPTLGYINPYIQFQGGERFGIPIKKDIGLSIGFGTPYSGALETNFVEANFHILGFRGGMFTAVDAFIELKGSENHNNLFVTNGIQFAYVIPFGNFFEIGYTSVSEDFSETQILKYTTQTVNKENIVYNPDSTIKYQPYLLTGSYINWEMRYPVKVLGATRGKFYVAQYIDEWHIGFTGRELSLAGSVFDLRFDAMFNSPVRQPQYVLDIMVQKIFDYWAFSTIAIGPSIIMSHTNSGSFGFTSLFANLRIKVGSSL